MAELPQNHFDNVVRAIKRCDADRVKVLQSGLLQTLIRLKARRNLSKAVTTVPPGSDQVDFMSIIVWSEGVERGDKAAVAQVVALDATTVARTGL